MVTVRAGLSPSTLAALDRQDQRYRGERVLWALGRKLWEEPIYRNVFGLLREFGDAEIASLIAPRSLVVEYSEVPKVDGPPLGREGRWAGPGQTRDSGAIEVEARSSVRSPAGLPAGHLWADSRPGMRTGSEPPLKALLGGRARTVSGRDHRDAGGRAGWRIRRARQERQLRQLVDYTQHLLREAESRAQASGAG